MGPESWVKLDPVAVGEILEGLPDVAACGEWILGFQAGSCGAAMSKTATTHWAAGHAYGRKALALREEDKARITERRRTAGAKGAGARWQNDGKGMANGDDLPSDSEWQNDGKGMAEERRGDILTDKTPCSPPRGDEIDPPGALPLGPTPALAPAQKAAATRQVNDQVRAIYQAYPRKDGLGAGTIRAIERALREVGFERILEAVGAFAEAVAKWPSEDRGVFVPMASTWFNGRRWEADRSTWVRHAETDPAAQRKSDERHAEDVRNRVRELEKAEHELDMAVRIRGAPIDSDEVQGLAEAVLRSAQRRREIDSRKWNSRLTPDSIAAITRAKQRVQNLSQTKEGNR